MLLNLYECLDSHNVVNKQKILKTSYEIVLKSNTNILNPTLKIFSDDDLTMVDYAEIDELNRFYHVVNIEPITNNLYNLYLEIDVIETYKNDIIGSSKVNSNNKVKPEIQIIESDKQYEEQLSYIISTIGGDEIVEPIE